MRADVGAGGDNQEKIEAAERVIAELRTMLSEVRRPWRRHVSLT
jgi:hypothetical protein